MKHTGFDFIHLDSPHKATGFQRLSDWEQLADINWDSTVSYAAGSIYSTVGDMIKWAKAAAMGQIIPRESWRLALTGYRHHYGYGWEVDSLKAVPYIGHSGGIPGFSSQLLVFPEKTFK